MFRLEDWATDILAVFDELQVERAVILGEGSSGHAAVQFAVTHPDRTLRLLLMNSYARLMMDRDYAIGSFTTDQVDDVAATIERNWGTGRLTAQFAPNLVTDPSFLDYFAGRERRTAPPRTAAAHARATLSSDIRKLLPRIRVPTMVYYTGDLVHIAVEHSRYLAEHIPGSTLVEAPGRSFYFPDETDRLNAWAEFIGGGPDARSVRPPSSSWAYTFWGSRSAVDCTLARSSCVPTEISGVLLSTSPRECGTPRLHDRYSCPRPLPISPPAPASSSTNEGGVSSKGFPGLGNSTRSCLHTDTRKQPQGSAKILDPIDGNHDLNRRASRSSIVRG
jgi:hypothetical protein